MKARIIIIGGGPAGIAAAIQLKRYNLDPLLFEPEKPGGLLKNANLVENYPGFPNGISGTKLTKLIQKQLESFNIQTRSEKVETLEFDKATSCFTIQASKATYQAEIVIVATGTKPKKLDIIESLSDKLKGLAFYEIFPIRNIKGKKIIIIGAGDAAFDYALNLSQNNEVIILNRSDIITALPPLKERVDESSKISYYADSSLENIEGKTEKGTKFVVEQMGKQISLNADYLVAAIGREANKDCFSQHLLGMEKELISQNRLYLIGDIINGLYRQVSIAVGDGIRAAMQIFYNLREKE